MTERLLFENVLIETNKVQAPPLLLEDFIYYANKAVYNYINLKYNFDDINQQGVDDLRVLRGSVILTPTRESYDDSILHGATYTVDLPLDYLHLLNCVAEYRNEKSDRCNKTTNVFYGVARLPSQSWSSIINNYYNRPTYKRPYYYIQNRTEPTINPDPTQASVSQNQLGLRNGNSSVPKMEVRYGKDDSVFKLEKVHVDYYRVPRKITLTQEQLDSTLDTSNVLEFPDYVCLEITKELVKLILEQSMDPRLQTNPAINNTIAPPINGGGR